jgi:tetratricopeptide (TPR) repeat protein
MQHKAADDDQVMNLVDLALARPARERETFLRSACGDDSELFGEVWSYVEAEQRMNGFLLDPLYRPAAPAVQFAPGDLVDGRFRIVREVAQGGMGIVYEAFDEKLKRRIAIKCAKPGFHRRLPPEVRNAQEISHPNVCKIFEIHTTSAGGVEFDYVTMEFLEGETLAARFRRGKMSPAEVRAVARQVSAGLAEAHRNRVVHGDLKSNNVILTTGADGALRAVITDFGLARRPEAPLPSVQSGEAAGTPDYMAPELLKAEKASPASDVYAAGVILYEMAAGRLPYGALDSWDDRFNRKPPSAHSRWDPILSRCLDANPARRFRNAGELAEALAPHSRRWIWAAAAAAVIFASLSGMFFYERGAGPREVVRLAMLPFDGAGDMKALGDALLVDTAERLSHIKPGRARLTVIPLSDALQNNVDTVSKARTVLGATHTISGEWQQQNGQLVVRAYLADARTQVRLAEWQVKYAAGEISNLPVALAGMVTIKLRLPPLAATATISPAAYQEWAQGVSLTRGDPQAIDQAIELLRRAVGDDPQSPLTHARLAEAEVLKYKLTGEEQWWDGARESLGRAEQRNPDVAAVRFVSAVINEYAGRYEEAQADLQRAIQIEPLNGDLWRELGMVYQRSNRPNEALSSFQKATDLQPDYFENYRSLASFYYDRLEFEQAVREYKYFVRVAPGSPVAHFGLARPYLAMGQYPEAERELRLAINLRETSNAVHTLAVSLAYQGRDGEAVPYYLRALELGPPPNNKFGLYMNLGTSYRRTGQSLQARRAYREALDLAYHELDRNPKDGFARSCLAYLSARLGERQEAEANAVQALALAAGDVNVSEMVAQTYEALGERDRTLALIASAPAPLLKMLERVPDLADLQKDSRFLQILADNHIH